jgi:L-fucose mutarotase
MLDAILPLMALDHAVKAPVIMMAVQEGDTADPAVEPAFRAMIDKHAPGTPPIQRIDRFEFYERARQAFAVVMTTETRTYGNILLKKGVTPAT